VAVAFRCRPHRSCNLTLAVASPTLQLNAEASGDSVRISLSGELDISTSPSLEKALEDIESDRPDQLVIDLRDLAFIDSTGLRVLVNADARAREAGRRLTIVRGSTAVERVFSVTGLDERFDLVDEPDQLSP
jgi:anti-sigma B factor antagonist